MPPSALNRGVRLVAGLAAALAPAVAAHALGPLHSDDEGAPLETVVARALLEFLPDADDPAFERRWSVVSIRAQRTRWHLAGPDASPEDGVTRAGWIPAEGASVGVHACGAAEEVAAVAIEMPGVFTDSEGPLLPALGAEGAELETKFVIGGDVRSGADTAMWGLTLTAPGRAPAELVATMWCTSPEARAAQRCATDYRLMLVPDTEEYAPLRAIAESCRYGRRR
jgi:hypothetical protein